MNNDGHQPLADDFDTLQSALDCSDTMASGLSRLSIRTPYIDAIGQSYDALYTKESTACDVIAFDLSRLEELLRVQHASPSALLSVISREILNAQHSQVPLEVLWHTAIKAPYVIFAPTEAVVALSYRADMEALVSNHFPDVAVVPFSSSEVVTADDIRRVLAKRPRAKALLLQHRGLMSFAQTPEAAKQTFCDISQQIARIFSVPDAEICAAESSCNSAVDIAPYIRGALAIGNIGDNQCDRCVLSFRQSPFILECLADHKTCRLITTIGASFPSSVLRDAPIAEGIQDNPQAIRQILTRHNPSSIRVVLVPGIGLFGVGDTAQVAKMNADLAYSALRVTRMIQYADITSLLPPPERERTTASAIRIHIVRNTTAQVVMVTGAGGGLGFETACLFKKEGAELALFDINQQAVVSAAEKLSALAVVCDVTSQESVAQGVDRVVSHYGGVDILISNAGAAFQGRMDEVDDDLFRQAFELNFWSHHLMARACVDVIKKQGTGGALVFNVTKQVLNPGPDFGPYGTSKSALMALVRQYAIEHSQDGITANAVNADRIRTGLLTNDFISQRAAARGITPEDYMRGNLLRREVTGRHVAEAFLHLSQASRTTGAILTVDGGNVAAMVR